MNVCGIQAVARAGDEQMRGHRSLPPVAVAAADVLGENLAGRAMQRHQPSLAEFGAADGQYCCLEIDILKLKVAGFPEAQPGNSQEAEQTVVAPRAQLPPFIAAWHLERGAQETLNLGMRVQIGSRPFWLKRQQTWRRNLGAWIDRAVMARESAHNTQAARPVRRLHS